MNDTCIGRGAVLVSSRRSEKMDYNVFAIIHHPEGVPERIECAFDPPVSYRFFVFEDKNRGYRLRSAEPDHNGLYHYDCVTTPEAVTV